MLRGGRRGGARSLTRAGRIAAVLGMVAVLGWAGEVRADPARASSSAACAPRRTSWRSTSPASEFAAGAALTDGKLSVRVDGVPVAATVRAGVLPPVRVRAGGVGEQPSRAVMVVLDARWPAAGEPLADTRAAITAYVGALPGDVNVGLVVVSELVRVLVTPTTDRGVLTAALDGVTAQGDLPLAEGVQRALEYLPTPIGGGQRRVLLVWDGGLTGPPEDAATGTPAIVDAVVPGSVPIDVVHTGVPAVDVALRPNAEEPAAAATAPPGAERAGAALGWPAPDRIGSGRQGRLGLRSPGSLVVSATTPGWLAGRSTTVTVEATVAGRRLTTAVPVRFPDRVAAGSVNADSGFGPAWLSGPVATVVATLALLALIIVWVRWALATRARHRRVGSIARYGTASNASTVDKQFEAEPMPVPWPVRLDPARGAGLGDGRHGGHGGRVGGGRPGDRARGAGATAGTAGAGAGWAAGAARADGTEAATRPRGPAAGCPCSGRPRGSGCWRGWRTTRSSCRGWTSNRCPLRRRPGPPYRCWPCC